jgi:hypothetical protein
MARSLPLGWNRTRRRRRWAKTSSVSCRTCASRRVQLLATQAIFPAIHATPHLPRAIRPTARETPLNSAGLLIHNVLARQRPVAQRTIPPMLGPMQPLRAAWDINRNTASQNGAVARWSIPAALQGLPQLIPASPDRLRNVRKSNRLQCGLCYLLHLANRRPGRRLQLYAISKF